MWFRLALLLAALGPVALAGGCGKQIGDSCILSTDCDPDGTRECDSMEPSGYCTIQGCDYNTCPDDSVCVRFFTGDFQNKPCVHDTEDVLPNGTNDCNPDEECDLNGFCALASAEVRYCMATCSSTGDCRDEYECRDLSLMKSDGGEPILAPGVLVDNSSPHFCAQAPAGSDS
jgi:hypothetical protein